MKLPGRTPLSSTIIPQEHIAFLRSLWIETAEEAIALAAAVSENGQPASIVAIRALSSGTLAAAVPHERLAILRQPHKGGGLGCVLDPQVLDTYRRDGRLWSPRRWPAGAFENRLPHAIRLVDRMQPVRDQGERGTCVAFASVALREFLLQQPEDLSEQFLYWACKELDGFPGAGTYIHTAMSVLAEYGVCRETDWPYNPKQTANEGQGPPPHGARDAAKAYRLASARTVEPGLVLHYKHVLAGEGGKGGMPVTFGVLVFNSWYMSRETHRTGKITLPLPGEEPVGGHAMCVVGYVDDDTVPGGGYFIVRNSWGAKWAAESPEAAGHALMPYEYVERFAMEAFTGPSPVGVHKEATPETSEWNEFVRSLERDERDLEGRLLKRGTRVLVNPSQPGVFREDTPENRQEFLRLHRAWTPEARSREWFPAKDDWPAEFSKELTRVQAARQAFLDTIDVNLKTSVGAEFPDINLPPVTSLLLWQPRIRRVYEEADLSDQIVAVLLRATGHPPEVTVPKEWEAALLSVNALRLYRLRSITADALVVAAFVAPIALRPGRDPAFTPPSPETLQAVRDLVRQHLAAAPGRRPVYTFFSVASAAPWPEDQKGVAAGDHCILLSYRTDSGEWHTLAPSSFVARVSFRNFMDRLYPITAEDRVIRVKSIVDRKIADGYEGNITVEKIAAETKFRKTTVRDAFLAMQQYGKDAYLVYKLPDRRIAIRLRRPNEPVKVTAASFQKGFLRRHFLLFLSATVGVSGWLIRDWLVKKGYVTSQDFWSIIILIFLVYATGLVQTQINRRASEEKE